jgi:hypothetical protein
MIPWSTVVEKTHDRERCNTFGDMESFSEMDTPLVGEGAPLTGGMTKFPRPGSPLENSMEIPHFLKVS